MAATSSSKGVKFVVAIILVVAFLATRDSEPAVTPRAAEPAPPLLPPPRVDRDALPRSIITPSPAAVAVEEREVEEKPVVKAPPPPPPPPPPPAFHRVGTQKQYQDFPDTSKPLLVLVTPADDPANLPRNLYDIIPLRRCFDVRWLIVYNMKSSATRAPMFRDIFPWITELQSFHPGSQRLSHQRNVGVEYALTEVVPTYGEHGFLYFLSTDNSLPNLCDVPIETRNASNVLFYREELRCGKRVFEGTEPAKDWSRGDALTQITCAAGEASFLIPLSLLNQVRPKWDLTQHHCGIDPTFFAALVNGAVATKGAAAAVQPWPQAFRTDQLHVDRGCVKPPWTQEALNASLAEYKALLRDMQSAQQGLNETQRMEHPYISFHTYVHILAAIRGTLPMDRTVQYLEIGIWKGATSLLMSRNSAPTNIIGVDYFYFRNQRTEADWMVSSLKGSNPITWFHASSRSNAAIEHVRDQLKGTLLDMYFIDGDHSTHGAMADFYTFSPLVASGGYIIFDDFMDTRSSAGVREALWLLTKSGAINSHEYEIFGTIPNVAGAGHWFRGGDFYDWQSSLLHNEFVIRKR
jgi:cephalosporin hydroxylase